MIIRLDTARDERLIWEESLEFSPAELKVPQIAGVSPIQVRGEVVFAAPDFALQMELRFELAIVCDRCAQAATNQVESHSGLMISTRPKRGRRGLEVELRQEELGWIEIVGEELDTAPLIAEQVQLEVPARPLCREDCAGLCPNCGADLNEGACSCERIGADSRWGAALSELKKRLNEEA